jgi:hypothetical protein
MSRHIQKHYWQIFSVVVLALLFGISIVSFTNTPIVNRSVKSSTAGNGDSVDGNVYWKVDYETGDLSQWNAINTGGSWGNSSIQVVTHPVRQGNYAAKFTLTGGNGAHVRAETEATQAQTGGYEGQDWYYSWSMYAPSNPNTSTGWGDWNLVTQWMDLLYQCSPPLQIDIMPLKNGLRYTLNSRLFDNKNGCASLGPSHDWDLGPVVYDQWIDITIHVKWSSDPTVGFAQVWMNGVNVFPLTHLRTLDTSGGVYMQQDIYRLGATSGSNVLYFDDLRRHDAYNPGTGITPTPNPTYTKTPLPSLSTTPTLTLSPTLSIAQASTSNPSTTGTDTQTLTPSPFNGAGTLTPTTIQITDNNNKPLSNAIVTYKTCSGQTGISSTDQNGNVNVPGCSMIESIIDNGKNIPVNQPINPDEHYKISVDPKKGIVTSISEYKNFNPLLFAIFPALLIAGIGIAVYLYKDKLIKLVG